MASSLFLGSNSAYYSQSTVDDLSYSPNEDEQARDKEHLAVTGRRSWKTLKHKDGEAVWPINVEVALIEALWLYVPPRTVNPEPAQPYRSQGRYPMRNRFISQHILKRTGKVRHPKQIGSRLQQLRETCRRPEILKLISPIRNEDIHWSTDGLTHSRSPPTALSFHNTNFPEALCPPFIHRQSAPNTSIPLHPLRPQLQPPNIKVTVNLDSSLSHPLLTPIPLAGYLPDEPLETTIYLTPLTAKAPLCEPLISCFDPSVQLWSPFLIEMETLFNVFWGCDEAQPIHSELATICLTRMPGRSGFCYTVQICPEYWQKRLANDPNLENYTLIQHIRGAGSQESSVVISYCFKRLEIELASPEPEPPCPGCTFAPLGMNSPSNDTSAMPEQCIPWAPINHQVAEQYESSYSSLAGWCGHTEDLRQDTASLCWDIGYRHSPSEVDVPRISRSWCPCCISTTDVDA